MPEQRVSASNYIDRYDSRVKLISMRDADGRQAIVLSDAAGNYSRSVLAARAGMHATLADVETRLACASGKACDNASAAFGLGLGSGTVFHAHMNVPVQPFATGTIPDGGVATTFAFANSPNSKRPSTDVAKPVPNPSSAPQDPSSPPRQQPSKPFGGSGSTGHGTTASSSASNSQASSVGSRGRSGGSGDTSTYLPPSSSSSDYRPSSY